MCGSKRTKMNPDESASLRPRAQKGRATGPARKPAATPSRFPDSVCPTRGRPEMSRYGWAMPLLTVQNSPWQLGDRNADPDDQMASYHPGSALAAPQTSRLAAPTPGLGGSPPAALWNS